MYLVNIQEDRHWVEASLGGKIDVDEMRVFGEELRDLIEDWNASTFALVLDCGKANAFDFATRKAFCEVKQSLLTLGAQKIVTIARDEHNANMLVSDRFQAVMEGLEDVVVDPSLVQLPEIAVATSAERRSA
jgi:hypothetical protein